MSKPNLHDVFRDLGRTTSLPVSELRNEQSKEVIASKQDGDELVLIGIHGQFSYVPAVHILWAAGGESVVVLGPGLSIDGGRPTSPAPASIYGVTWSDNPKLQTRIINVLRNNGLLTIEDVAEEIRRTGLRYANHIGPVSREAIRRAVSEYYRGAHGNARGENP